MRIIATFFLRNNKETMRPPLLYPLFAGIETLNGIGEKTARLVRHLTGDKIVDLLWHLPASIIDRRYSPRLANARIGSIVTVKVRVLEHIEPKLKKLPYKIVCTDGSEENEDPDTQVFDCAQCTL